MSATDPKRTRPYRELGDKTAIVRLLVRASLWNVTVPGDKMPDIRDLPIMTSVVGRRRDHCGRNILGRHRLPWRLLLFGEWLPWKERPAGHPRSAIPDRTSLLAQIRLFGVGHGVGNEAARENRLAVFKRAWSCWADTLSAMPY